MTNFEDLDDLSSSQALDRYKVTEANLGYFNDINFGDFDLLSKHENVEISDGKRFQSVKKSGYDDIKQLIANEHLEEYKLGQTYWDE